MLHNRSKYVRSLFVVLVALGLGIALFLGLPVTETHAQGPAPVVDPCAVPPAGSGYTTRPWWCPAITPSGTVSTTVVISGTVNPAWFNWCMANLAVCMNMPSPLTNTVAITMPVAPTAPTAPAATVAAPACMTKARFLALKTAAETAYPTKLDSRISALIGMLDAEFNLDPTLGYRGPAGTVIDNPGVQTMVWSDYGGTLDLVPTLNPTAPGGPSRNWIAMKGFNQAPAGLPQAGWGFHALFTSATLKTTATAIRICEVTEVW